jgi:hypothetical protein
MDLAASHNPPPRFPLPRSLRSFLFYAASFLVTVVALGGASQFFRHPSAKSGATPSPQESAAAQAISPSDEPLSNCLSPDTIKELTGQKLELVYEEWVPDTHLRWCRYLDAESSDLAPTQLEYKYTNLDAEKTFSDRKSQTQNQATFRQLSDQPQAFVLINPVKELHQAQFFIRNGQKYLELTFSPASLDEGQMIEKGFGVGKKVLEK